MNPALLLFSLKTALVGGVVAADETAFGQFMLSRPIAAGFLTGLVNGNVLLGSVLGALFELLYLDVLPVGGSKFPSAGLAAVTAVSVCDYLGFESVGDASWFIPVLFLFSAMSATVGGWLVIRVRQTNTRLIGVAEKAVLKGNFLTAGAVHLSGILFSFMRGFVTVMAFFLLAVSCYDPFSGFVPANGSIPGFLLVPFIALGIASLLRSYVTGRRALQVLVGGFITLIILYLTGKS